MLGVIKDQVQNAIRKHNAGAARQDGEAIALNSGISVGFLVGENSFPHTVVDWSTVGENCVFAFSPLLVEAARVEFVARRLVATFPLIDAYYHHGGSPNRGLFINLEDHTVLPGLSFCGRDDGEFLVPDPVFLETQGYRLLKAEMAQQLPEWETRTRLAVWRGATTGAAVADWHDLPRVRLCQLAASRPDLLNAGIADIVQLPAAAAAEIRASGLIREPIPAAGFAAWRYQIDIDGNTNSWPGLYQKLLTGSPVIKVASPGNWRQWYYDRLVAWKNYIPVKHDLSDLPARIEWLREHDDAARSIGQRGRELALSLDHAVEVSAAVPVIAAALATLGHQ